MTVGQLMRTVTESEFLRWQQYAARHLLPARRADLYLARLTLVVARAAGNDHRLEDYLISPPDEEPAGDVDLHKELGFAPRNRKH